MQISRYLSGVFAEQPVPKNADPRGARLVLLWCGILAIAGILLFFHLGSYSALKRHEVYVAEPAREMVASGDWLVPNFGGHPRLEKGPLSYWMVAALGLLQGEINEWTVRLPAAISGLLLVGLMGTWGSLWYGSRVGLCAALIQATSAHMIIWGRLGLVDMPLTLLIALGLFLAATFSCAPGSDGTSRTAKRAQASISPRWILFFIVLGLAGLAKPAFGPALIIVSYVAFLLIQHRRRDLLYLVSPFGVALVAVLILFWPYMVWQRNPDLLKVWYDETIGFALGTTDYRQPAWFYAATIPGITLPWTPLILIALPQSWQRAWKERDARERFLWISFLTQVLVLSLSVGKSEKYALAAVCSLTLIASQKLAALTLSAEANQRPLLGTRGTVMGVLVSLTIVGATAFLLAKKWPELTSVSFFVAGICGVGLALMVGVLRSGRRWAAAVIVILIVLSCYMSVTAWVVPRYDYMRPAVEFAKNVALFVPPDQRVFVYAMNRPPLVFYLERPAFVEETQEGLQERLAREKSIYVVSYRHTIKQLVTVGDISTLYERDSPRKGNLSDGDGLVLVKLTSN